MDVRSAEPATPAPPRRRRGGPFAVAEVTAAGFVLAAVTARLLDPAGIEDGPVVCPFRLLTGLPCPGCGLTRSWVYAAHGGWGESLSAHPLGLLLAAMLLVLTGAVVRARWQGLGAPDLDRIVRRPWFLGVLGVWLAFAVVRAVLSV